jgi:hypothetical protein
MKAAEERRAEAERRLSQRSSEVPGGETEDRRTSYEPVSTAGETANRVRPEGAQPDQVRGSSRDAHRWSGRAVLDEEGYPAWVTSLVRSDSSISLLAVSGLDVRAALRVAGAPAGAVTPVALPDGASGDGYADPLAEAVASQPGDVRAWLGFEIGDWTVVFQDGLPLPSDPTVPLSRDGREALSCSSNGEGDTHVRYAVDGRTEFFVGERVSIIPLNELPERLRAPAQAGGIYDRPDEDKARRPAENFRLIGELVGLLFPLDELRRRPLLGARA